MKDKVRMMAEVFKALGDPTRLRIIKMLASNPDSTLCVADLASKLGVTQPAASQHIRILKHVEILEPKKVGFRTYYYLNPQSLSKYRVNVDELFELAFARCSREETCKENGE